MRDRSSTTFCERHRSFRQPLPCGTTQNPSLDAPSFRLIPLRPLLPHGKRSPQVPYGSGMCRPPSSAQCYSFMEMWPAWYGIPISQKPCLSDAKAISTMAWSLCGIPYQKGPGRLTLANACLVRRRGADPELCGSAGSTLRALRCFSSRTPRITCLHGLATQNQARHRGVTPSSMGRV